METEREREREGGAAQVPSNGIEHTCALQKNLEVDRNQMRGFWTKKENVWKKGKKERDFLTIKERMGKREKETGR